MCVLQHSFCLNKLPGVVHFFSAVELDEETTFNYISQEIFYQQDTIQPEYCPDHGIIQGKLPNHSNSEVNC